MRGTYTSRGCRTQCVPKCCSRSSVSGEHLMDPSMSVCLSRFSRGTQPTCLVIIDPAGVFNLHDRESVFLRGYSTCTAGGHCSQGVLMLLWPVVIRPFSAGVLNLHALGWQYKNSPKHNNDIGSRQCNNDLRDVEWRTPLKCQCTSSCTGLEVNAENAGIDLCSCLSTFTK
jgi:hypothetical protein